MALVFWMLKVLLHTKVWSFQKHFDIITFSTNGISEKRVSEAKRENMTRNTVKKHNPTIYILLFIGCLGKYKKCRESPRSFEE